MCGTGASPVNDPRSSGPAARASPPGGPRPRTPETPRSSIRRRLRRPGRRPGPDPVGGPVEQRGQFTAQPVRHLVPRPHRQPVPSGTARIVRHSMGLGINRFWRYVSSTTAAASCQTDGSMGSPASPRNAMLLSPSNSRTESSTPIEKGTSHVPHPHLTAPGADRVHPGLGRRPPLHPRRPQLGRRLTSRLAARPGPALRRTSHPRHCRLRACRKQIESHPAMKEGWGQRCGAARYAFPLI